VREIFINNDTFDKLGVFNGSTSLSNDFDEVEVDVFALKIGNVKYCSYCKVCEVVLALTDNFRSESGCGALTQELVVVFGNVKSFLDLANLLYGNLASLLETIGDLEWVNAFVKKLLSLFKDCSSKDNNSCSAVSDFIVLGGRKFC
jgi:hypothetical protein